MAKLPKNYYKDKMMKFNVSRTEVGFKLNLNYTPLGIKLDKAQDALDDAVWDSIEKRMPVGETGQLKNRANVINQSTRGEVWIYDPELEYSHYQYVGKKYVDPITGKGAFYSPEYGFWSRPGVPKVPTDIPLVYSQPNAVSLWGEVAIREDSQYWLEVVKRAMKE